MSLRKDFVKRRGVIEVVVSLESSTHCTFFLRLWCLSSESNLRRTTRSEPHWKSTLETSTLARPLYGPKDFAFYGHLEAF